MRGFLIRASSGQISYRSPPLGLTRHAGHHHFSPLMHAPLMARPSVNFILCIWACRGNVLEDKSDTVILLPQIIP